MHPSRQKRWARKSQAHAITQNKSLAHKEALRRGIRKTHAICEKDEAFKAKRIVRILKVGTKHHRHDLDGLTLKSRPELVLACLFQWLGLSWRYEPRPGIPYVSNGKSRVYFPDFLLGSAYLEYRPCFRQDAELTAKLDAVRSSGKTIYLVSEKDVKDWGLEPVLRHFCYIAAKQGSNKHRKRDVLKYMESLRASIQVPAWLWSLK
jgi:hypothetical protein